MFVYIRLIKATYKNASLMKILNTFATTHYIFLGLLKNNIMQIIYTPSILDLSRINYQSESEESLLDFLFLLFLLWDDLFFFFSSFFRRLSSRVSDL